MKIQSSATSVELRQKIPSDNPTWDEQKYPECCTIIYTRDLPESRASSIDKFCESNELALMADILENGMCMKCLIVGKKPLFFPIKFYHHVPYMNIVVDRPEESRTKKIFE